MFSRDIIEEDRNADAVKSLLVSFVHIGDSGIIKKHVDLLQKQLVQGHYTEADEVLMAKIKDTRLKVSMLESLQYFCDHIDIEE